MAKVCGRMSSTNIIIACIVCIGLPVGWYYAISQPFRTRVVSLDDSNSKSKGTGASMEEDLSSANEAVLKEKLSAAEQKVASLEQDLAVEGILAEKLRRAEQRVQKLENTLKRYNMLSEANAVTVPSGSQLGRDLNYSLTHKSMEDHVTVVIFSYEENWECLSRRIDTVRKEYPSIEIMVLASTKYENLTTQKIEVVPNIVKEGKALEIMASSLTSEYFLFLSSGAEILPHNSDQGFSWLFHALEKIPELDFVGGALLSYVAGVKYPTLEIPCYRLRLCNWTLTQSFEYRYSVDDMMICEETSSSFMGRTNSLKKLDNFDPNLDTLATTDFFLRAKGKAVVGLRPEVRFPLYKSCKLPILTKAAEADLKLPFMRKHQLYIVRNSFGREVLAVDSKDYSSFDYGIVHWEHGTYASPFHIRGLLLNLEVAADYFESKNITYYLDAGFPLGGIKMRGILPWDRDIDLGYFAKSSDVKQGLEQFCKDRGIKARVATDPLEEGLTEVILYAGDFGYNTMFEKPYKENPDDYMYIYIHGRRYPVYKSMFYMLRAYYGIQYLKMRVHSNRNMKCTKVGHHACVPEEFADGGGHWRDFYCQL